MSFSTRFLSVFTGLALLISTGGYFYADYLDFRLSSSLSACGIESKQITALLVEAKNPPKITQTLNVFRIKSLEFPVGMSQEEIVARVRVNFHKVREGFDDSPDDIPQLVSQTLTATYQVDLPDWGKFSIDGLAGKTQTEVLSAMRKVAGVNFWCDTAKFPALKSDGGAFKFSLAQQRLMQSQYSKLDVSESKAKLFGLAFCLVLFGMIPAIWYFLLRRLSEIASAIRGK